MGENDGVDDAGDAEKADVLDGDLRAGVDSDFIPDRDPDNDPDVLGDDEPEDESEGEPEGERGFVRISALVAVARDGQKAILIGKGGSMLKQIGTAARMRIEKFLGCRVHLELFVKVIPDWTEKQRSLAEFGYRPE